MVVASIVIVLSIIRALIATAAAMLPRRYWPALDGSLPVSRCALAASIVTLAAGAALGCFGFFEHLYAVAGQNNAAYLDAAIGFQGESLPLPSALSGLSFFTFILLTPQGWLSTYLAVTGTIRAIGSQFDDPHGDFVLTAADAAYRRVRAATLRRVQIDTRHLLEGPCVRDRVVRGAQLGLPDAELVIVASRLKNDWTIGAVVVSNRGEFRIIGTEDRTIDGRLRRLYALSRHDDLEVFRRTVSYEFPDHARPGGVVRP